MVKKVIKNIRFVYGPTFIGPDGNDILTSSHDWPLALLTIKGGIPSDKAVDEALRFFSPDTLTVQLYHFMERGKYGEKNDIFLDPAPYKRKYLDYDKLLKAYGAVTEPEKKIELLKFYVKKMHEKVQEKKGELVDLIEEDKILASPTGYFRRWKEKDFIDEAAHAQMAFLAVMKELAPELLWGMSSEAVTVISYRRLSAEGMEVEGFANYGAKMIGVNPDILKRIKPPPSKDQEEFKKAVLVVEEEVMHYLDCKLGLTEDVAFQRLAADFIGSKSYDEVDYLLNNIHRDGKISLKEQDPRYVPSELFVSFMQIKNSLIGQNLPPQEVRKSMDAYFGKEISEMCYKFHDQIKLHALSAKTNERHKR